MNGPGGFTRNTRLTSAHLFRAQFNCCIRLSSVDASTNSGADVNLQSDVTSATPCKFHQLHSQRQLFVFRSNTWLTRTRQLATKTVVLLPERRLASCLLKRFDVAGPCTLATAPTTASPAQPQLRYHSAASRSLVERISNQIYQRQTSHRNARTND